jgi:signal transduction histidine kinase
MVLGWMQVAPAALTFAIGIASMAAGVWRIRAGLSSVDRIRLQLGAVHRGERTLVAGPFPSEVQPLVDDVNALLQEREQRVQRAVAKTADLAHGLKTPLAVLAKDASDIAAANRAVADSVYAQVDRMRRQIEYHLAHARAAAGSSTLGVRTAVEPSVEALLRVMMRLHADRGLAIDAAVPPGHAVRCRREDFEEIVGNLLDNACKWARSRVRVESALVGANVAIFVDDDGHGIDAAIAATVLQRGIRADERVPGSGLGLAIVRDLLELYRGSIELTRSPLGGLRARVHLPTSDAADT